MPVRSAAALTSPAALAAALLFLGLWAGWGWWQDGTPVQVTRAAASGTKLPCVSYAPSRQSGHERGGLAVQQLRRDLALLATRTGCIRTYTVSEGYDRVPEVAREFGMQVLLGLWISRDDAQNEIEIARGVQVARAHRDVIRAVVVGNEVLLRHERTAPQLATMLRRVATATGLPVTYADVWGYWIRYPELAREVSFVTVHILPYWDDDPVGIDAVLPAVDRLYTKLQRRFPGSTLFVGETGWPTAGRPRGAAAPGRRNQARFLAEFAELAQRRGFDYNVIEAFDQPWKMAHEGTAGGHWGLYDATARPKAGADGHVVEHRHGRAIAVAALLAGLLVAIASAVVARRSRYRGTTMAGAAGLGAFAVAVAARQWQYLVNGNLGWLDWAATLVVVALGWMTLGGAARAGLGRPTAKHPAIPRGVETGLLACAAYVCLGLVFAGRHRDFPVWLFLPGVLGLAWVAFRNLRERAARLRARSASEEVVLATWLLVAGATIPLLEGFANARALGWASSCLLLGLAVLGPLAVQARERKRRNDDSGTGPGEVVQHHAKGADDETGVREPVR